MKKILIAQEIIDILQQKNSFLERADMLVLAAASNDEALAIHRAERADDLDRRDGQRIGPRT